MAKEPPGMRLYKVVCALNERVMSRRCENRANLLLLSGRLMVVTAICLSGSVFLHAAACKENIFLPLGPGQVQSMHLSHYPVGHYY